MQSTTYEFTWFNSHIKMRKFMIPLLISAVPNLFLYTACLDQSTNEDHYLEIRIFLISDERHVLLYL